MKYLFLQKDLNLLEKEFNHLIKEHVKFSDDMKEATSQSSETWHDNPMFDDVIERSNLSAERILKLKEIIQNSKIVEANPKSKKVQIGGIVQVLDSDKKKTYKIGSFLVLDKTKEKDIKEISYNSLIGRILLNKKVGDKVVLEINNKQKILEILNTKT